MRRAEWLSVFLLAVAVGGCSTRHYAVIRVTNPAEVEIAQHTLTAVPALIGSSPSKTTIVRGPNGSLLSEADGLVVVAADAIIRTTLGSTEIDVVGSYLEDDLGHPRTNVLVDACLRYGLYKENLANADDEVAGPAASGTSKCVRRDDERRWSAEAFGFNVHAGVTVRGGDRESLERPCRYGARPARVSCISNRVARCPPFESAPRLAREGVDRERALQKLGSRR